MDATNNLNPTAAKPPLSQRPVLLYDASCPFCRKNVRRLVRLTGNRVDAAPAKEVLGDNAAPGEIKLLLPDGQLLGGADAILTALAQRPIWRPLATIGRLPVIRLLPNAAYRWVAKRRHKLGQACTDESCPAPASAHPGAKA